MLERSEPVLKGVCVALAGLLLFQAARPVFRSDPLAHLNIPALPTLPPDTNAPAGRERMLSRPLARATQPRMRRTLAPRSPARQRILFPATNLELLGPISRIRRRHRKGRTSRCQLPRQEPAQTPPPKHVPGPREPTPSRARIQPGPT